MYHEPIMDKIRRLTKRILKSSNLGKGIYPVIQRIWRGFAIPARIKRLHRYGYEVLADVHRLLVAHNIPYYCDCGTLLGFIRDNGFIKHDDDIDICIMPGFTHLSEVLKIFLDAGYGYVHGFKYEKRFIEFTVKHPRHITIDVFQHVKNASDGHFLDEIFIRWFADRQYPDEKANTGLKFILLGPESLKTTKIHGVDVVIPSNAEEVLDSEYGPWRTPDSGFNSEQLPHEELPGFVYRMPKEEALAM